MYRDKRLGPLGGSNRRTIGVGSLGRLVGRLFHWRSPAPPGRLYRRLFGIIGRLSARLLPFAIDLPFRVAETLCRCKNFRASLIYVLYDLTPCRPGYFIPKLS